MRLALVTALFVALAPAPLAHAGPPPLSTRLAPALEVPGISAAASGAVAVDLATGHTVFARNPDTPLAPASNEKLTVTFTALEELGNTYRFRTEVLGRGRQNGSAWVERRLSEGVRRPDAHLSRPRAARDPAGACRNHAHRGPGARRRIVVRQRAHRARLESVLLPQRVPAALRARGRPRRLRASHRARTGARGGGTLPPAAPCARDHDRAGGSRPRA